MRRREFIAWLGAAATPGAWPLSAPAQPTKIPRVGYVWFGRPDPNVGLAGLRQGLADRGYVLGRNLLLEERYAEGDRDRRRGGGLGRRRSRGQPLSTWRQRHGPVVVVGGNQLEMARIFEGGCPEAQSSRRSGERQPSYLGRNAPN